MADKLSRSIIFKDFRKTLVSQFGEETANQIWVGANTSLLTDYGRQMGGKIARIVHGITSIPGLSKLLWKHMPKLMRITSSPEKGYTRRIVSETKELVGVDILTCPLHDAAVKIGVS